MSGLLWLTSIVFALFLLGAAVALLVGKGLRKHVMPKATGRPDGGKAFDEHLPEHKPDKFVDK